MTLRVLFLLYEYLMEVNLFLFKMLSLLRVHVLCHYKVISKHNIIQLSAFSHEASHFMKFTISKYSPTATVMFSSSFRLSGWCIKCKNVKHNKQIQSQTWIHFNFTIVESKAMYYNHSRR